MWYSFFFFSSRRRHTRCALVTGVQTCALPISPRRARPVLLAQGRDGGIVLRPADVRRRGAVGSHAMASEHNEQMSGGQQADLLVLGGRVVTMDAERRVLHGGGVAVAGDRIVAVDGAAENGRAHV